MARAFVNAAQELSIGRGRIAPARERDAASVFEHEARQVDGVRARMLAQRSVLLMIHVAARIAADMLDARDALAVDVERGGLKILMLEIGDAERERLKDNVDSLKELAQNLTKQGKNFRAFPLIMQYNKIDLPSALPVPVLDKYLNPMKVPRYESVAIRGSGVFETLRGICRLVTNQL